jgi:eukaryotic-like serine/threonine-protein kinase
LSARTVAAGRYRVERTIGSGGMALVVLARDTELDRPVAIKLLAENLARDAEFRRRFVREARLAAGLAHPNVARIFDAGEDGDRPYIVMEHVEGETLADVLARRGRVPPDEAVRLAIQACAGLQHAHDTGLVHRDVKPQNLLLRDDGTLKLVDFGIARAAETTRLTQAGTILGTAAYLAPEQAAGDEVTSAADVYSLGVVLYELLTGRTPYTFETLAELADRSAADPIRPIADLAPGVPPALEDVVMRCLARNPAYRPSSAAELARELRAALPPGQRTAVTEPLGNGARAPGHDPSGHVPGSDAGSVSRRRLAWPALGLAALSAAVVAFAFLGTGGDDPPPAPPRVGPVPPADGAAQQARNLAAWLRRNSG